MRDYVSMGGFVGSKVTISPDNVHLIKDAIISMINEGYREIFLNCVYEDVWNIKCASILYSQLKELINWMSDNDMLDKVWLSMFDEKTCKPHDDNDNKNYCGGNGLMISLGVDGEIYPCQRYSEASICNREPFIIGTVDDGINIKQEHCDRIKCLECVTRKSQSTEECISCPIASGCGWCTAYHYEIFGDVNKRATFICDMHKARSLAKYYYNKMMGYDTILYCPKEWAIPIIGKEEYEKLEGM